MPSTTDLTVNGVALTGDDFEVARKAVETALIDMRDSGMFVLRRNGLVVYNRDGGDSSIIRLSTEDALRIGLEAIVARRAMPEVRVRGPIAYTGRPAVNGRIVSSFANPEMPLMVGGISATGVVFAGQTDAVEIVDGVVWASATVRSSDPAGTRYPVAIATQTAATSNAELVGVEVVEDDADAAWSDAYLEVLP